MFDRLRRTLVMLTHGAQMDRDLDEEMRLHTDLLARQLSESGLAAAESRLAARRRFGSPLRIREDSHEALGWRGLEDLVQDLRYAFRSFARQPSFVATVVLTLALGIGATTAIFSVVHGVVLRPLPFPKPDRLVQVYQTSPLSPQGGNVGGAELSRFRDGSTSFDSIAAYGVSARYLQGGGESRRVMGVESELTLFAVLGVQPIAGRTFRPDDPANVVVTSESFWRARLEGDPSAIGRTINLDGNSFTVIGVMPDAFQFPYGAASLLRGSTSEERTDLWYPFGPPGQPIRGRPSVVARLSQNITLSAAESELAVVARRLEAESPTTNTGLGVRLTPLAEAVVPPLIRRQLFVLFGAVLFVLALTCANVMNLSLVRMSTRSRELGVRWALGAGASRLARQLLTESLLLSAIGGGLGFWLAWWGTGQLTLIASAGLPRAQEVGVDWQVFLFLLATCLSTGLLFGLAPILFNRQGSRQDNVQESASHTMTAGTRRFRNGLVVAEVALAFALGVGASMLIRELVRLRNTDPGMVTTNVVTFHIGHRMTPRTDVRQFYEIADRVAALPGVRAAGFIQQLPLQNWGWVSNSTDFRPRNAPSSDGPVFPIELRYVTPGYFDALSIPILKGRPFTASDTHDSPPVILINEALARRRFDGRDPVGIETTRGTIVGIVRDVRQVSLDRPADPELYYPAAQNWSQVSDLGMSLVVRADTRPDVLVDPVRSVVRQVNQGLAVFNVRTMERVRTDSLADFTLYLSLIAAFAALALLLAATGTYGVISYVVASRMREFAIRLAMGADRIRLIRLILGDAARLIAVGLGVGAVLAVVSSRALQDLPITVRQPNAATIALVAVLVSAAGVCACLAPARRAANADPMSVLRDE